VLESTGFMKESYLLCSDPQFDVSLDYCIGDEQIGRANLKFYKNPVPYYCLGSVEIEESLQNKGFGVKLFDRVTTFLEEKKIPGILKSELGINDTEREKGFYFKKNWQRIANGIYGYKPKEVDEKKFKKLKKLFSIKFDIDFSNLRV